MISFIYPHTSFWHWLVYDERLQNVIINDIVGGLIGLIIIGLVVRPAVLRLHDAVIREWRDHVETQHKIADRLDAETPGGIRDLIDAVRDQKP